MTTLSEADVEQVALDWLNRIGWAVTHGPDIAPDAPTPERSGYDQVALAQRLRDALVALNRHLEASVDIFHKIGDIGGCQEERIHQL